MLTNIQQASRAIQDSQEILVVTKGDLRGDAIASVVGLYMILDKLGKRVTVISGEKPMNTLQFLPHIDQISQTLPSAKDFIISLDISKTKVDQLSYKVEGDKLNVVITPKDGGGYRPEDISTASGQPKYDLIITVNTSDLEHLENLYSDNAELFLQTPIVNLDHNPSNEGYGKINVVDINAASTTQVIYKIAKEFSKENQIIDKEVATALLTGLIAETESFQTFSTTPEVLKAASELIELGAEQQVIIRYLFKTKTLSTLNLWGRVLARLRQNADDKLVWSMLSEEDFKKSEASHKDIEGVMQELLSTMPGAEVLLVLYEKDHKIHGKIHAPHNIDAVKIASLFENSKGHFDMADFSVSEKSLSEAEQRVTKKVREQLKK